MIRPAADYATPNVPVMPVAKAERMAGAYGRRAFWRGVVIGGLTVGAAFLAGAAWAVDISGSTVVVRPTDVPGAVAEVLFDNVDRNGAHDNGAYTAAGAGLVVGVTFEWEVGMFGQDAVTITPPEGLICRPASCRIEVMEGFSGTLLLLDYVGM